MSNPHAHPHTMRKAHAKFQNNWYKTVRGVALTRDTLCLYNQGEKWLSSQCRKSDKNWSNNYVQSTCISSYHEENTCNVSKQWVQNCKRSCANKIPMLNVDGWTDGWMNGRKLAHLCLPAKAGATKMKCRLRAASNEITGGLQLVCRRPTLALSSAMVPQTLSCSVWEDDS